MKVLAVLLFCLSAAAALHLKFERNRRYSYNYVGWVAHGITEALEKDLALKIKAKAHFDFLPSKFVRMTLEDVKLVKVVDKVLYNDRVDTKVGEETALDNVNARLQGCLELPIRFRFKFGSVERMIITEQGVKEWCVNIQRAIVNHMYLPIVDNSYKYQIRINEVTHLGKCKTAYTIINENPYYKVKRVIDLTRCKYRPQLRQFSLPNTDAFYQKRFGRTTARMLPNFVRNAAYMHYDLDGTKKDGFIIRKVVSENIAELTLNGDQYQGGKAVGAHTKQELTLYAKAQPIPSSAKVIKNGQTRRGLMFVFYQYKTETESTVAQENFFRQALQHITAITKHVQDDKVKPETAIEFTRLVSVLRHCTADTLKRVVKVITDSTVPKAKLLLIDALARIGTEEAGLVLKESIAGGKFAKKLDRIAFGLGWVRGLDTAYIKNVMEICQDSNVVGDVKAHRSCWLSVGTLVNRLMVNMRRNVRLRQDVRMIFFRRLIVKTYMQLMRDAKDDEERITYIKSIGNAGWITVDIFKMICEIMDKENTPLHMKVQAVWAWRHMARIAPLLVRRKCLPLLANPLVDPEIRSSCYKILIQNDPSLLTVQTIGAVIAREASGRAGPRSNQFVSFVASDLRTSINYDNIDMVKASRARLLLRVIPRALRFRFFSYSKAINIPIDAGNNFGMELRLHKINGRQTFIPRHIHTKLKINQPGISADFLEIGARIQGIHDVLMPYLGPDHGNREKRSLDILQYIFGTVTEEERENIRKKIGIQTKLPPRLESYIKMYGSEVLFGKLVEGDILEIVREALFGSKEATEGGCTFTAKDIKCDMPFVRGHLLSEKRYMIPTLSGFPLKYSAKVAVVLKGSMSTTVTGTPKLIGSKKFDVKFTVKPTIAFHMHHKVGVWLPIFETGILVRHEMLSQPKIDATLAIDKQGFTLTAPITKDDQKLLVLKPGVKGVMRTELSVGDRQWCDVDLQLRERGLVRVPETCYGKDYLTLWLCVKGRIADPDYLRLKRLTTFPYYWLNEYDIRIKSDDENPPTTFVASYKITTNTDAVYEGVGKMEMFGKFENSAIMKPHCDKKKKTCDTKWFFNHKKCVETCKADTKIDYSQENRMEFNTEYTEYGSGKQNWNQEVLVEDEGKTLRIVNTWSKLPKWFLEYLRLNRLRITTFLHRFFGIKEEIGMEKRFEIVAKLFDPFVVDIFANGPTMQLRRINQELPFEKKKFNLKNPLEMFKPFFGTCVVDGAPHIKTTGYNGPTRIETTDHVIIKEQIPGHCPFVLAQDAREDMPKWRILLKKSQGGGQIFIIEMGDDKIEVEADKTVKVNGKEVVVESEMLKVPGGKIVMKNNEVYYEADVGFYCALYGRTIVVLFSPWYHNRIQGICGNNDGEQWTDFVTQRKTVMPETMTREFLREWVVEGKTCNDPQCKLKGKHINMTSGVPPGKVCFTTGRFLRCMAECTPEQTHQLRGVPYHCVRADDTLVARIQAGDPTVALETKPVDIWGPVKEHLTCACNCN